MERARQFLIGTEFLLQTDHRLLEFIFNQYRSLLSHKCKDHEVTVKIMAFDFDIVYVKGGSIPHADALTRLHFLDKSPKWVVEKSIHWTAEDSFLGELYNKKRLETDCHRIS